MQYAGSELSFNFPSAADCKNIFLRINIQQFFRRKQCNPKGKKILFIPCHTRITLIRLRTSCKQAVFKIRYSLQISRQHIFVRHCQHFCYVQNGAKCLSINLYRSYIPISSSLQLIFSLFFLNFLLIDFQTLMD